jgi:L-threonylcarbamoyladenylate synthase
MMASEGAAGREGERANAELRRAAELIRSGGLVAFPTETVYGLGANAFDAVAVARIFTVKGRPRQSPLIVHVDSIEMARGLVLKWPDAADLLARRYWPGPLTLVLPKQPSIPDIVTAGLGTVGLRVPSHPLALALIRAAGVPIAAPSANPFTQLSPTTAEHVRQSLGGAVDLILDGGPSSVGIESTVLSLAGPEPVLLRHGVISLPEIEALAGQVRIAEVAAVGAYASPGMHPRHYRPRTPLVLLAAGDAPPDGRGGWLRFGREMPAEPSAYAAALYAALHRLDAQGLDWIAVERPPDMPEWTGVRDRLTRAADR